jgi:predicted transcriptional regulator
VVRPLLFFLEKVTTMSVTEKIEWLVTPPASLRGFLKSETIVIHDRAELMDLSRALSAFNDMVFEAAGKIHLSPKNRLKSSIKKRIDAILAYAETHNSFTVKDISAAFGLSAKRTHRILKEMADRKLISSCRVGLSCIYTKNPEKIVINGEGS